MKKGGETMEDTKKEQVTETKYGDALKRAVDQLPVDQQRIIVAHVQGIMSGMLYSQRQAS